MRDINLVRAGQRPDAEIDGFLFAELCHKVRLFRAKLDARDIAQAHDRAAAVNDDQFLELFHRVQVGVREQIDLDEVALRPANGGEKVVSPQRGLNVAWREIERGEAIGINPDAHRKRASPFDGHAQDASQRRELWL